MGLWSRIFGYGTSTQVLVVNPGTDFVDRSGRSLAAAVCAVGRISDDIARVRAKVVNREGVEVDSRVPDLLNRQAARALSGFSYRRFATRVALTHGNSISIIRRDNQGEPVELVPVPAGMTEIVVRETEPRYRVNGVELEPFDVLHLGAFHDETNPWWFKSPFEAAPTVFATAISENTAHRTLARTGLPGKVAISHKGTIAEELVTKIKKAWRLMHAKEDGAAEPLVLRNGLEATPLFGSNGDWLIEARRFSVQEIARVFQLPPEMLYQQAGGALASQVETARAYVDGAMSTWAEVWAAEVSLKLLRPGERLLLDIRSLLKGNLRDQGMALSKLKLAGVCSADEARDYLDLPARGGDADKLETQMPGALQGNPDGGEVQANA